MSSWEVRVKMRGTPLRSLSLVPRERHAGILQSRARNPGTCEQLLSCWSVPKNQRKKRLQFFRDSRLRGKTVINWKHAMVWERQVLMSDKDVTHLPLVQAGQVT